MVNQFDATTEYHVTILLDLDDPYILKHEALLEESIRITAGLAAQLIWAKMPVRVRSNCAQTVLETSAVCATKQIHQPGHRSSAENAPVHADISAKNSNLTPLHVELSATSGNLTPLLQELACLDTAQICISMDALIASELAAKRSQEIYVVVSKNNTPELAASLKTLETSGSLPMIVCPVKSCDADKQYGETSVPILYWEVKE
jgi:hypothetical protein